MLVLTYDIASARCSFFFFSSRRRHTRFKCDWSSDVCSSDLGPIMFVPHRTETGRSKHEVPARPRVEPEPARGQHSEKVSARKEQDLPFDRPHPAYHPVGPCSDLIRRLPSRAAVAEQLPVRTLGANVSAGATFIRAVVPFEEIRLDFGHAAEASPLPR